MMSTRYILLVFFIVHIPLCALANRKTDSLIHIVHEYEKKTHFESDTNYIKALIDVSEIFGTTHPDSSLFYGNKAYELSTRCGYSKGVLESAFIKGRIYTRRQDVQSLKQIGNEILPIAEKTNRKSLNRVYVIIGCAYFYEATLIKLIIIRQRKCFKNH